LLWLIFLSGRRFSAARENSELTAEYQQIISDDTQQFDDAFLQKNRITYRRRPSLGSREAPRLMAI